MSIERTKRIRFRRLQRRKHRREQKIMSQQKFKAKTTRTVPLIKKS